MAFPDWSSMLGFSTKVCVPGGQAGVAATWASIAPYGCVTVSEVPKGRLGITLKSEGLSTAIGSEKWTITAACSSPPTSAASSIATMLGHSWSAVSGTFVRSMHGLQGILPDTMLFCSNTDQLVTVAGGLPIAERRTSKSTTFPLILRPMGVPGDSCQVPAVNT